jgi:hypothetical protein
MALGNKKAMGPVRSPMAFYPEVGIYFMGDPCENKNKSKTKKIFS